MSKYVIRCHDGVGYDGWIGAAAVGDCSSRVSIRRSLKDAIRYPSRPQAEHIAECLKRRGIEDELTVLSEEDAAKIEVTA